MKLKELTLAAAAAMTAAAPAASAEEQYLRAMTGPPGTHEHFVVTSFASAAQSAVEGLTIQVTAGTAATRATVEAAQGDTDIFQAAPSILSWLAAGERMYADLENHEELHGKLRSIFAFPLGSFQWVVYEDSGIESMEDLRGRRVFAGPSGAAAPSMMVQLLEGQTGMKADEDYQLVGLDWSSGPSALQDGQVDVFVRPTGVPSADIQQLAALRDIRLLGFDDDKIESDGIQAVLSVPGNAVGTIKPDAYGDAQVNNGPVNVIELWIGLGTHSGVSDDTVYEMTRAWWENVEEIRASAPFAAATLTRENAFGHINIPLHPGALRYYQEAGFDIPQRVLDLE